MKGKRATLDSGESTNSHPGSNFDAFEQSPAGEAALQELLASVIDQTLMKFIAKAASDTERGTVPSVADAIRLMQLRRELTADEPIREIEVRWVEPSVTGYSE